MTNEPELTTADLAQPKGAENDDSSSRESADESIADTHPAETGEVAARPDERDVPAQAQTGEPNGGAAVNATPLLPTEETERFRGEWTSIQGEFVDQPREAVEKADALVADLMQRLAAQFAESRTNLERQWDGQDDVSTEDLRVAMTSYRSFFERLLSA